MKNYVFDVDNKMILLILDFSDDEKY